MATTRSTTPPAASCRRRRGQALQNHPVLARRSIRVHGSAGTRARAARVHERSLIDASMPLALVMGNANGHGAAALPAAPVVGDERHVVDAAVARRVAVGA